MKYATAIESLLTAMRDELGAAIRASKDAGDYATSDEARAKSKYDTQSTESSYLAAGQANRAEDIAVAILDLEKIRDSAPQRKPRTTADLGSLIQCDWGKEQDWYLIVTKGGGTSAKAGREEVTTITGESALGRALTGKSAQQNFRLPTGASGTLGQLLNG